VTVAPVMTRILNNEQPLWTVRSRGDTFYDMDDTKKSFTALTKHTCLVRYSIIFSYVGRPTKDGV